MSERSHRHIAPAVLGAKVLLALRSTAAAQALGGGSPHLPPKPAEMSWRDYLIMLLHIGGELEHALMVEYLYAAYSIGGAGIGPRADVVRGWQDEILTIAREEMGHLLSVQNALLLLGAPISFERDDFPWSGPFNAFPFELEPLSLKSLAKYLYSEMPDPDTVKGPDKALVARVEALVGPDAGVRVGQVYDRIIALVEDRRRVPDSAFFPESYDSQMDWDEWGRSYRPESHKPYAAHPEIPPAGSRKTTVLVPKVATRTELAAALRAIASQGEAEHLSVKPRAEPSHFDRFAKIFREYEAFLLEDPSFTPSRPVPRNPVVAEDADFAPEGATRITHPESCEWATLFNVRYRILLTLLTYAASGPREHPELAKERRPTVISRIFGEMYNLKAIAGMLARLPLGDPADPARAGAPFQMPYTLVLAPEASFWRLQLELLEVSEELIAELLARGPELPDGGRYLRALREADAVARGWIEGVLGLKRKSPSRNA
ncbi:MAG: ferritin-like protein [Sandaracinaceae bacterium]|nr:ferritin-like protein [Sandaracinaceae bacterium]